MSEANDNENEPGSTDADNVEDAPSTKLNEDNVPSVEEKQKKNEDEDERRNKPDATIKTNTTSNLEKLQPDGSKKVRDQEFCTIGADGVLRIWSVQEKRMMRHPCELGAAATACCYAADGTSSIAVGVEERKNDTTSPRIIIAAEDEMGFSFQRAAFLSWQCARCYHAPI